MQRRTVIILKCLMFYAEVFVSEKERKSVLSKNGCLHGIAYITLVMYFCTLPLDHFCIISK